MISKAIISCVKQEERYIREWLDYHINVGFDHFFLADNNDSGYSPSLESVISDYIDKGIVTLINFQNIHPIQPICYNKILEQYGEMYDWFAIIDIDEFITLPRDSNIGAFLSNFEDTDIIFLHWQYYGDSNYVNYENRPVQERFTVPVCKPNIDNGRCNFIKSLFRKPSLIENHTGQPFKVSSQHSIVNNFSNGLIRRNCLGEVCIDEKRVENIPYKEEEYEVAYIKHYITKSLEEFMTIRRNRGGALQKSTDRIYSRYDVSKYFIYNNMTKEKSDYLKNVHNIDTKFLRQVKNEFDFCYIIDDNEEQMKMLFNSIESLLRCYGKYGPTIYIINLEDRESKSSIKLNEFVEKTDAKIIIKFFDKNLCKILPMPTRAVNRSYLGFNSLSRFFIPYIIESRSVFYVDNDILFIKDAYNKIVSSADSEYLLKMWMQYTSEDDCHINAGFMFINCKRWRHDKSVFLSVLDYYIKNVHNIKFMNQSCYIWLAQERYRDMCIIKDDKNINSRTLDENVEIFHGNGKSKDFYLSGYEKFIKNCRNDDTVL